jgi:hypothetical protein
LVGEHLRLSLRSRSFLNVRSARSVVFFFVLLGTAQFLAPAIAQDTPGLSLINPGATAANLGVDQQSTPQPVLNSFQTFNAAADATGNIQPAQMQLIQDPRRAFAASGQPDMQMPPPGELTSSNYNRQRMNEGIDHLLRVVPRSSTSAPHSPLYNFRAKVADALPAGQAAQPNPPAGIMGTLASVNPFADITIAGGAVARGAVYADTTKVANAASAAFLPSNIPVEGQQFFGAPARALLSAGGSTLNLTAGEPIKNIPVSATAIATVDQSDTGLSVELQQAWLQIDNVIVGQIETAFADNGALPFTLDLEGPNARVTVGQNGAPSGQGRIGYFLLPMPKNGPGPEFSVNMEMPTPEIATASNAAASKSTSTFARYPDFTSTFRYSGGCFNSKQEYEEEWHVQLAGVVRDLGLENANQTLERHETGWGLSLSGHLAFLTPISNVVADRISGSITGGQGIAHYIADLHTGGINDAVLTDNRSLDALTAIAGYAGYTHNWSDYWRSTATYSHVTLDSVKTAAQTTSPYRFGDYFAVNIVYHIVTDGSLLPHPVADNVKTYKFTSGFEYLYGRKETLDGHAGDDQRFMWVTAVEN